MQTYWHLRADVLPEFGEFQNVVRAVHWECFAQSGDERERIYGSVDLPLPTDPETYVDLTELQGASEEERRSVILGWADMIQPGMVASTEARVIARLTERLGSPATSKLEIL